MCWTVASDTCNNTCTKRDWSSSRYIPFVHFPYPSLILYESVSFFYSFTLCLVAARFSAETRFKYRVASFVACAICVSLSPFLSFLDARKEKKRRRALRQHALRYVAKNERSSSKVKFIKSTINVRTIYKKKKKKREIFERSNKSKTFSPSYRDPAIFLTDNSSPRWTYNFIANSYNISNTSNRWTFFLFIYSYRSSYRFPPYVLLNETNKTKTAPTIPYASYKQATIVIPLFQSVFDSSLIYVGCIIVHLRRLIKGSCVRYYRKKQ